MSHRLTGWCIPFVIAVGPWQHSSERRKEKPESPRDDNIIVEVHIKGYKHYRIPDTLKQD